MYIHAGKRIEKQLKQDDYHIRLFADQLRLGFEYVVNVKKKYIDVNKNPNNKA